MTTSILPRPSIAAVSASLRPAFARQWAGVQWAGVRRRCSALPPLAPLLLRHGGAGAVLGLGALLYAYAALALAVGGGPAATAPAATAPIVAARTIAAVSAPPAIAPESDPAALVPISAADALVQNAAIPVTAGPNPAAAAFRLPADEVARMRSVDCLTAAVYYEAGMEPADGQRAVAQVILNRVRHPHYPNSVCGVIFQGHQRVTGCQFTFTCDGSLRRTPAPSIWARARAVAEAALAGYVHRPVGWATHYHANYVLPYWAPTLAKVATIGAHIFYRWDGGWGRPGAFAGRYTGAEPAIAWRGGFGQQERGTIVVTAQGAEIEVVAPVGARDAAAAQAAVEAQAAARVPNAGGNAGAPSASVESFQRAVVRRYVPVSRDNAAEIIQTRERNQPTTDSNRWALTGEGSGRPQAPLGRRGEGEPAPPVELEGVRRRAPAEAPGNVAEAR